MTKSRQDVSKKGDNERCEMSEIVACHKLNRISFTGSSALKEASDLQECAMQEQEY